MHARKRESKKLSPVYGKITGLRIIVFQPYWGFSFLQNMGMTIAQQNIT
jgi:hypothetical protein